MTGSDAGKGRRGAHHRVAVRGAVLGAETFGDRIHPPIVLIAGAGASMLAWDDEICAGLAAAGRFVVRYDQRDTGRSTTCPVGAPDYAVADLARDVVGLLDGLGLTRAHLAGVSLGGMVAQLVALDFPGRVDSLTLVSTSPAPPGSGDDDLPPPSLRTLVELDDVAPPDWSDRESAVTYLAECARLRAGAAGFDEVTARARAGREYDHTADLRAAVANHTMLAHDGPWRSRLAGLRTPALVVHGAADPLVPPAHARVLAAEIPGADLLLLPGAGHDLRATDWAVVLPRMLRHTETAATTADAPARALRGGPPATARR